MLVLAWRKLQLQKALVRRYIRCNRYHVPTRKKAYVTFKRPHTSRKCYGSSSHKTAAHGNTRNRS